MRKNAPPGVASILQGQVVTGMKMSEARGKDLGDGSDDPAINFSSFSEILKWRAKSTPDNVLFAQIGSKVSGNYFICNCDTKCTKCENV